MKQFNLLILGIISTMILGACSTSNEVVGGVFQKRKHTGGVYWDRTEKVKASAQKEEEEMEFDIYKLEEAKQKKYASVTTIKSETKTSENTVVASAESEDVDGLVVTEESKPVIEATVSTTVSDERNTAASETSKKRVSKSAQEKKDKKSVKKNDSRLPGGSDAMFILAVILAILIPPLGVLVYTNIDWMKVLICFLLCLLFFLPGMIYALLVVFDVI